MLSKFADETVYSRLGEDGDIAVIDRCTSCNGLLCEMHTLRTGPKRELMQRVKEFVLE